MVLGIGSVGIILTHQRQCKIVTKIPRKCQSQILSYQYHQEEVQTNNDGELILKYIENFTTKNGKVSDKKFWHFFHIPAHAAQNIDCGYSLNRLC